MCKRFVIFYKCLVCFSYVLSCVFFSFPCSPKTYALIIQTQPEVASSSSFLPVGSGARAMGMGGAYIAIADDATASSWNPACLIQLKRPQLSFVAEHFIRRDDSKFASYPESSTSYKTTSTDINYLSLTYPTYIFRRNIVFSLNYQHLYNMDLRFSRKWQYIEINDDGRIDLDINWRFKKQGGLSAISPALAIQIIESLALGLTINFWPVQVGSWWDNGWEKESCLEFKGIIDDVLPLDTKTQERDHYTFSGTNFHLGFLWKIDSVFTLGGVFKTRFTAKLKRKIQTIMTIKGIPEEPQEEYSEERLIMPPSYGLGISARISDNSSIALDIYQTDWKAHKLISGEGTFSPITDEPIDTYKIKSTNHMRLGLEYNIIRARQITSLRIGAFYDPEPAKGKVNDFYGIACGAGISSRWGLSIDFAYQYRFSHAIPTISFQGETARDRVEQHLFYLSFIFYL